MGYLAILFAAAFLLLLLSYFMQQRNSEQTISWLKDSASAQDSVEGLIEENKSLHQQVDQLEGEIEDLKGENTLLDSARRTQNNTINGLQDQLEAMDWLWRIQRTWSRGERGSCRELVEQFEDTGLPASLPESPLADVDGPSPADQYDSLLDALGYRPEP